MSNAKPSAKTTATRSTGRASAPITGIFATLSHLLRLPGSGAPARRRERLSQSDFSGANKAAAFVPAGGVLAIVLAAAALLLSVSISAAPAQAAEFECPPKCFGLHDVDVVYTGKAGENLTQAGLPTGEVITQAGEHPFSMTTSFRVNGEENEKGGEEPFAQIRDVLFTQMRGFAGAPTAVPVCSLADFLLPNPKNSELPNCADTAVLGTVAVELASRDGGKATFYSPVYNLEPSPGVAARLGFWTTEIPVTLDAELSEEPPYRVIAGPTNTPQLVEVMGSVFTLWGVPADPAHDALRGACLKVNTGESIGQCPADAAEAPFITMPRNCDGPLATEYDAAAWAPYDAATETFLPAQTESGEVLTHDEAGNPQEMTGCGSLTFAPEITAQPTARAATSPTGLDFSLEVTDEGLTNPDGIAGADIAKTVVTLPEGMSVNPSQAEGLAVCTEAQLEGERSFSGPGEGCPEAAKIGSIEVETPLLQDKLLKGSLYVAEPYANRFGSLLAIYIVIKNRELGVSVIQAAEVTPDPQTGRLTTVASEMPEIPFSSFRLHFREGTRSPLVTPAACGTYTTTALLYPSSGAAPITSSSDFQIISGPGNSPCPSGGLPPFKPGLLAGTLNNAAGAFSPFNLRLFRSDSEQEFTRFSIKLPPGIAGILAGIPHCPDAAIEAAKLKSGAEELASPSCPAASEVGRSLAGAGVGPALTYAPGKIYLAGPYEGAPISIAAITAAKVGPFDVGTVVIRQGFKIDPRTAEVFLDPIGSDPIPHIVDGIVVHARDIRAYVDRPNFVFNPTSCEPTSTASTVLGSGLDFVSPADDNPVVVSSRFQAADCAALPFKPKLTFRLKGGTQRGAHPSLRAHVEAGGLGNANIASARVTLPRSEFLENDHIGTVCTRVQYAVDQCPAASVYGFAEARTPILDQPLKGPIYLRSSENPLPDLVVGFRSAEGIKFDLVGRVDSVKGGGIRNAFEIVPDAPVTSADFTFFGQKKGLLVNSTNLCKGKHLVKVELTAHSGKTSNYKTPLKAKCKKSSKRHARR